jgi:hypothetical protein
MWNPFSWVSAADKATGAAKTIIDGFVSGADKLFLTDEEKRDYAVKAQGMYIKHQELVLNENTARSITRRYIAVMITVVSLALTIFTIGIAAYDIELAKTTMSIIQAFGVDNAFLAVLIFYFGSYGLTGIVGKVKGNN